MRLTGVQCKEMYWFLFKWVSATSVISTCLVIAAAAVGALTPTGQMIPLNINDDIYVLDADRRLVTNITQTRLPERSPSIAPDGNQIVFAVDNGSHLNLYATSINNRGTQNLTDALPNRFFAYPTWSPDGTQVAFAAEQPVGDLDIFLLNLADGTSRRLTNNPYGDNMPAWSPDGEHLVYVAAGATDPADLWVIDATCEDCSPQPLSVSGAIDFYPAWSPDGNQIAFISNRSGQYDLYIHSAHCLMTEDCIFQNPVWLRIPRLIPMPLLWSDDGKQIIFQSGLNGRLPDLYAVDADCVADPNGCTPEPLTQFNRILWAARWQWRS